MHGRDLAAGLHSGIETNYQNKKKIQFLTATPIRVGIGPQSLETLAYWVKM